MFFGVRSNYLKEFFKYSYPPTGGTPAYHLAVAIATASAMTNRQFYMYLGDDKIYTNMWLVLVGRSSVARKTTTINAGRRLLSEVFPDPPVYPNDYTPEALHDLLDKSSQNSIPVI